jgi:RNA-binding protein YlmH
MNSANNQNDLLVARITDLYYLSAERNKPQFTGFLNEQEISICMDTLNTFSFDDYSFYGGYNNSQRMVLGFGANEDDFPISVIEFTFRKQDKLNHRQFLGTILSTGLKRSVVGDILCMEGKAYVFILSSQAEYVMNNINRVARVGVKSKLIELADFSYTPEFVYKDYIIASMRLDNVVSAITKLSREKTRTLILSGNVFKNYIETDNLSAKVKQGDVISVRRYGKFVIESQGGITKKGRLKLTIRQYI